MNSIEISNNRNDEEQPMMTNSDKVYYHLEKLSFTFTHVFIFSLFESIFDNTGAVINNAASKNGKYTSVSVHVEMKNPESVINKYQQILRNTKKYKEIPRNTKKY